MREECYFCISKTVERILDKNSLNALDANDFLYHLHQVVGNNWNKPMPYLATQIHRTARKKLNNQNIYAWEKKQANQLLLKKYSFWKNWVNKNSNPMHAAAKLAVVGNIIDYGAHALEDDIEKQINHLLTLPLAIDHTQALFNKISEAKNILYLGDNAGEIVFDKLFIETMNHPNVTFAVRGANVINDVTLNDAIDVGMIKHCKVISNGYDAPSTILPKCSPEFNNIFNRADLIISKGQGNFEGLLQNKHPHLFFMLMAKCHTMANMLGVKKGDLVIKKQS